MKRIIELGAVRMGAAIQYVCANVDFEVLSLPGGSLIALLLWLHAIGARGLELPASRLTRRFPRCALRTRILRAS
jgi:hypothetical protein